ncbi:hypothetical protein KR059_007458, partial [Drosophila kikkawai]
NITMFRNYARTLCLCVGLFLLSFVWINQQHEDFSHKFVAISRKISTLTVTKIDENESTPKETSRFFVFSPQCKIPYVNPFDVSFQQWDLLKFKPCTNEPALVSVIYDSSKRQYKLHLNTDVAKKNFSSYGNYGCTCQETRSGSGDTIALGKAAYIHQDWPVPTHFVGVIVECHEVRNKSRVLQRDAFFFIQYPKNRNEANDAKRGAEYPSVFLFGIDSMSRMNFHRSMPLTAKFVSQEGWYEMEGYNKVGDNTLPNLLAVLTGRTPRQWRSKCDVRKEGCLDSLPFLWDLFRNAGYLTAYAEDLASMSTFNYLKEGFSRRPVDFYLRHFMMVIEQEMKTINYDELNFCVGRRHSFSYILDFAKQLIERFVVENPKPLFGLFWTSSCTHDDFQGGRHLDKPFVRYLEQFREYGLFKNSIVILLSDHGTRFGPLAEHFTGFLEERLPMLHIYIPPWYRKRYPRVANALQLNRNRLSSNYDLYLGIRQIIEEIHPRMEFQPLFPPNTIHSILRVLPRNRTCSQAGIPEHWCTCKPFVNVQVTDFFVELSKLIVDRMNEFLKMLGVEGDCHLVIPKKILQADQQLHFDDLGNVVAAPNGLETFRLLFTTIPNDGMFRTIVHSNANHSIFHTEVDMISRVSPYKNESYCVKDAVAKKFCLCRKDK